MAQVYPLRVFRYNPARVTLADVVTQPYDKITPAMQERYYVASPGNLVRIILGKREPGDTDRDNVYTRAAAYFSEWRRNQILVQDAQPSFYAYAQRFLVPGKRGPEHERLGFIGLGQIEDYEAGVVFRHELTLSAPKTDRLNLLRATRAHFGQIFMLYSDPERSIDSLLFPRSVPPDIDLTDEYGVEHCLWKVSDPGVINRIKAVMQDKKLIIADGHHRYETARNYRDERRKTAEELGAGCDPDAAYERVMMTFVNMDSPGLVVLPTHRVIFGLESFDIARLVEESRRYFTVNPLRERLDATGAARMLARAGTGDTALVAVTPAGDFLFEARPEADAAPCMSSLSARQRRLDVSKLHTIILEHVLGISAEDIRSQKHINYVRDMAEAIERGRHNANAAFLMNPVSMQQMREVAFAGEVMPQKSTDFYPKLLSGLAVYALE